MATDTSNTQDLDHPAEGLGEILDPLSVDMDDDELVRVVDQRVSFSERVMKTLSIPDRQEKMRKYMFGDQLPKTASGTLDFHKYQAPYMDNRLFQNMRAMKPVALSRIPDVLVKAGPSGNKIAAEKIGKALSARLKKRDLREVLGMAFKHRPIFLFGVIKSRWDPSIGKHGDFVFEWRHPKNIILDMNAVDKDVENHEYIGEYLQLSAAEWMMRFPDKADALMNELGWSEEDKKDKMRFATPVRGIEFWFTYFDKRTNPITNQIEFTKINAVLWKYKNVIFKVMKNPNWDWEGETNYFTYEGFEKIKKEVSLEELQAQMLEGTMIPNLQAEKVYKNYLKNPLKPYIIIGYEQWGEAPIDMTSEVEQAILLQDNYNKRGRQITEQGDRSKGKHVFSSESGLTKADVQEMDMSDPNQDLWVDGDITKVHTFIPGTPPDAAQFRNQEVIGRAIDATMGISGVLRGEIASDVATTNQIAREGNFSIIDDIVEETINYAAQKMAEHSLQYMKLRYTQDHFVEFVGADGKSTHEALNQDMIDDGMVAEVDASGTDKDKLKREAFERAKLTLTDPLSFFQDTGAPDPVGRTEKFMMAQMSPELYFQRFVKGEEAAQTAYRLGQQLPPQGGTVPPQSPMLGGGMAQPGGMQSGIPMGAGPSSLPPAAPMPTGPGTTSGMPATRTPSTSL